MHSRFVPTFELPLTDIRVDPNFVADKRLVEMYCQLHAGKLKVGLTRLPISAITSGYYERQTNIVARVSNLRSEHVPSVERSVRGGSRPMLDLYWSPFGPDGGTYVCPDDENILAAYSNLNLTLVPCRILRPQKVDASEASIWLEMRGKYIGLAKAVAPTSDGYASFIGNALPPFPNLVHLLIDKCEETRTTIVEFHKDNGLGVHYHHMLHSLLRRHERLLDSICQLVTLGRAEHASALTRVAYEAFLNFYIDWLSPEFFGPRLQLLAAVRAGQDERPKTPDDNLTGLSNFVGFLENASEKARISPLGAFFHGSIYPPLSLVAHQSYVHLEHEASEFHDVDLLDPPSRVEQLGRWLDILTAALLIRVRNEIGITPDINPAATSDAR